MSDCIHCEIHALLESHLKGEEADLTEIAFKVTEVLADLILMAPPADQGDAARSWAEHARAAPHGTKIGTITSYASTAVCQHYDVAFWIGLTIVTPTAAPDITVTFR